MNAMILLEEELATQRATISELMRRLDAQQSQVFPAMAAILNALKVCTGESIYSTIHYEIVSFFQALGDIMLGVIAASTH